MSPSPPHDAPARSLLYVPGDRAGWVDKACRSGADAVIVDLEDAVAPANKERARVEAGRAVREHLDRGPDAPQLWVRINPAGALEDLSAVVGAALHTIVLPKADARLTTGVAAVLDALERSAGLEPGTVGVVPLLETARGVQEVASIAVLPRVRRFALGEADLAAELGLVPGPERAELSPIRSRVVVASAVAGLERPIGPVHTVLGDTDGLIRSSRQQYRQGFRGRTAIHPQQVPMINEEMSPTASELASARKLLASFDASAGDGITAFTGEGGQLVDPATVRRAREIVTAAARPGAASTPTTATDRVE